MWVLLKMEDPYSIYHGLYLLIIFYKGKAVGSEYSKFGKHPNL